MREIKFRGKRIDSSEWVYGNLFKWKRYGKYLSIIGMGVQNGSIDGYEVDPETVGQFTGLKDKNGKELDWWENDILDNAAARWQIVFETGCFCVKPIGKFDESGIYAQYTKPHLSMNIALRALKGANKVGSESIHETKQVK